MESDEVLNYIRDQFAKGVARDEIEKALLSSGWAKEQIDKAFQTINSQTAIPADVQLNPISSHPQKEFSFKKPLLIFGIIAVVFILTSGGIFFFLKSQRNNKLQESAVEQDGIVNWKMYKSELHGYEIKYPPEWKFKEIPADEIDRGIARIVFGPQEELHEGITAPNVEDINNISILKLSSKFSLETTLASYNFKEPGKNLLVGGYSARQFEKPFGHEQGGVLYVTTFVKRGNDLFVVTGNFIPSVLSLTKRSPEELRGIYDRMLLSMKFIAQATTIPEQETDTSNWQSYTNPEFGYSLKIPPGWKEKIDSDNEQKRFRVYGPDGSSSDELGKFEAELQILTLPYDHPAVKDTRSEQERLQEVNRQLGLNPGAEETIEGLPVKKIKNVNLDGCETPQFFFNEGGYKYGYSTACLGKTRYLSLLLFADRPEIVEKYKSIYDAVVESFKFNQFKL